MENNNLTEKQEVTTEAHKEVGEEMNPKQALENQGLSNMSKTKKPQGWILSSILLVAVVILYILFFTKKEKESPVVLATGKSSGLVLTVNNDSIVEHFVLVEILKSDLEKEMTKYQSEIQAKSAAFEDKYRNYMINVQNNALTQTQMQNAERTLMDEKTKLEELSAKYTEIMSKKEISVHREIMDSIINATQRVNAKYNADYVFATSESSAIICSNPAYDITKEVIAELNNAYNKAHKK